MSHMALGCNDADGDD